MSMMEFVCEECGGIYRRHYSWLGKTHTCSRKCAREHLRRNVDDDMIIEMYRKGMSSLDIGRTVGLSWSAVIKRLKAKGERIRSRSENLKIKNPTKGRGHTVSTREKLSIMATRQFSDHKQRELASHNQCLYLAKNLVSSVSGVEDRVAAELDKRGVCYSRQVPVRDPLTGRYGACVDFMIGDVVVEVNGTFWHCDRRVYAGGPTCDSQRRTAAAYGKKMLLMERLGIRVLEIWEKDVDEDVALAVNCMMEKI